MRIVVVGASGNVGTSTLAALANDPEVESIVGVSRRTPARSFPKTEWVAADIVSSPLTEVFAGADVVIHLAWLIQPSRDLATLRAVNVDGSRRVFEAVRNAGVPALVYASSVGAYSPGPKDRRVHESWPTEGIDSSFYATHKAETERMLDAFERENPGIRVVRLRPGLIFKRDAASGIRRGRSSAVGSRGPANSRLIPIAASRLKIRPGSSRTTRIPGFSRSNASSIRSVSALWVA